MSIFVDMNTRVEENTVVEIATEKEVTVLEASHVYVHCYFNNTVKDMLIRVWKTTFLIDRGSTHRSKLIHVENISYAPQWTAIPENGVYQFLLIFDALPKNCELFDLLEDIPQPGGFYVANIMRNKKDVYHVYI
jgi:hypothetical protein